MVVGAVLCRITDGILAQRRLEVGVYATCQAKNELPRLPRRREANRLLSPKTVELSNQVLGPQVRVSPQHLH